MTALPVPRGRWTVGDTSHVVAVVSTAGPADVLTTVCGTGPTPWADGRSSRPTDWPCAACALAGPGAPTHRATTREGAPT